jgi:multicomponent Na+:H+ antiporter subunit F
MHDVVFIIAAIWLIALSAALAVIAAGARSVARKLIAFDTLSYVLVAALAVIAIHRAEAGFLDIALVIAALGFVQTVAVTRLVTGREPPP